MTKSTSSQGVTRREFLAAAAGIGIGLAVAPRIAAQPAYARPPDRPNVVLIIVDTLRADKCGCYGYHIDTTPGLDRLAANGVIFDRVISQCSWTRPSIGSLITSQHARDVGLYEERGQALSLAVPTLPEVLKAEGYQTYGYTANPNINSRYNFNQGFDFYQDSNVLFSWMKGADDAVRGETATLPPATQLFGQVLDMAREAPAAPHYVQMNVMEVHEWYMQRTMIRPDYREMFLDSGESFPRYLQSMRQVTDDISLFVEELTSIPGWENTLFVITSDHGEGLDSHPNVPNSDKHGWLLYESHVVVPWILYSKAWTPARGCVRQPVRLMELAPTLLDFLGISAPESMEGESLMPVIHRERETVPLPEYFITETYWGYANKTAV
ncbi:MAG: sulfatase-like hydrolase/transferase, partial [Candidatus Hydrogenedentes bacterium]|nr:sulfatase-like hydrolase/transferase [Candidatus Hydrogenedentota bacterium]